MVVVELDGDSMEQVAGLPQLLFFRDGAKLKTHVGFDGNADGLRRIVADYLGVLVEERTSAAEESFGRAALTRKMRSTRSLSGIGGARAVSRGRNPCTRGIHDCTAHTD